VIVLLSGGVGPSLRDLLELSIMHVQMETLRVKVDGRWLTSPHSPAGGGDDEDEDETAVCDSSTTRPTDVHTLCSRLPVSVSLLSPQQ